MTLADDARVEAERRHQETEWTQRATVLAFRSTFEAGAEWQREFMQSRVIPDEEIEAVAKVLTGLSDNLWGEMIRDPLLEYYRDMARRALEAQREVWNQ